MSPVELSRPRRPILIAALVVILIVAAVVAVILSREGREVPTPTPFLSPELFTSPLPATSPTPLSLEPRGLVAFHSDRGGNLDIWVMRDNGTDLRQLTTDPERDIEPDWSPDGRQIAFVSGRADPLDVQLYLMNADGSEQRPLLPFVAADHLSPRWSPDGQVIVFYTNRDGNFEVYVTDLAGTQVVNLTQHPADDMTPAWSPDGRQLVFSSNRGGASNLYIMNADGSGLRQLTSGDWLDTRPDWSPDGQQIVFVSNRLGPLGLWSVSVEGGDPVPISDDVRVGNRDPRWAGPKMLLFSSDRVRGLWAIYRMDAEGKEVYALTYGANLDGGPAWTGAAAEHSGLSEQRSS